MVLFFAAFVAWPVPTFATVVALLPAAALLFPIRDSGRLSERVVWRAYAGYCAAAFVSVLAVAAMVFAALLAAVLLMPFFASLLVFARDALPS